MSAPGKSLWPCLELACCNGYPDADDEGRRVHPSLSTVNHWPLHVSGMHVGPEGGTLGNCTISDTYLQVIRGDLDGLSAVSSKVQLLFICGDFLGVLFGLKLSFTWITLQLFKQVEVCEGLNRMAA